MVDHKVAEIARRKDSILFFQIENARDFVKLRRTLLIDNKIYSKQRNFSNEFIEPNA